MRRSPRMAAFLLGMLAIPALALADTAPGGFPAGPLWLSKTTLADGDSVQIFAAVYDPGNAKINGDTVFLVDGASIGTVHFELNPGEAKIASLSWNAKEGTHSISAQIDNAADTEAKQSLSLSKDKTQGLTVTVAAPPPQPAVLKMLSAASGAVSSAVGAALPAVTAAADAVFSQTENLRTEAQTALQTSLGQVEPVSLKAAPSGQVLGAETQKLLTAGAAAAAAPVGFSFVRLLEQVLLFIVSSLWLFYPLLLLVILAALYFIAKTLSRKKPAGA